MGSYGIRMGFLEDSYGFLWVPIGFLCPPLLVCPAMRSQCCPVLVSYYICIFQGASRIPKGSSGIPIGVDDDDDNDVVANDVAAAVSDDDDDDNGHSGDHHHHPQRNPHEIVM